MFTDFILENHRNTRIHYDSSPTYKNIFSKIKNCLTDIDVNIDVNMNKYFRFNESSRHKCRPVFIIYRMLGKVERHMSG